ncbi:putative cytochrome P450 CYP44 isoform X2 [Tubulanus polymorphus]|uniref:putative cytochrome P450 CYP44 isoform X2 n=1 Tax=Tubulanus polymorphus TaxID=672921 RepID=UPI003DA3BA74
MLFIRRTGSIHCSSRELQQLNFSIATTCYSNSGVVDDDAASSAGFSPRPHVKSFDQIPGPKPFPLFGSALYFRGPFGKPETYHEALLDYKRQFGAVVRETLPDKTVIHIFDPECYKNYFQIEDKQPHIPPLLETLKMYRAKRELSLGIGNTNGEEWYRLRSAVQKLLMRPKEISAFFNRSFEVIEDLVEHIHNIRDKNNEVENIKNIFSRWTLESAAMTCFERRLNCLNAASDSDFQKMIDANDTLFKISRKLNFSLPFYRYFPTPAWRKLLQVEDFFYGKGRQWLSEAVSTLKQLAEKDELKEERFAFLRYLLSNEEIDYKDVTVIALSLFGDGLSTTVPVFVGQLYCIATNPDKQEKLYAEINRVLGSEKLTPQKINEMSYLKACIKESFRFFPVGSEVSRILKSDAVIGGYHMPAGTHIELNNFAQFRDAEYFTDADEFLPERWLRGGSARDIHPYLLTPFGHGVRMCVGRRFAEQDMQILMVKLVQKYRIEWRNEKPLKQSYQMLFVPDQTSKFAFIER